VNCLHTNKAIINIACRIIQQASLNNSNLKKQKNDIDNVYILLVGRNLLTSWQESALNNNRIIILKNNKIIIIFYATDKIIS